MPVDDDRACGEVAGSGWRDIGVPPKTARARTMGAAIGVGIAVCVYFLVPPIVPDAAPAGFNASSARATAAVAALMAVWWMTQAIPLAATALVPLALFPTLGVCSVEAAAAPYANKVIFLFLGGFMLALSMQRWNLHRRIALGVVLVVGTRPRRMVLGFMLATGLLSMWVSNTATAVMMLPIGMSVLGLVTREESGASQGKRTSNLATSLMLGIAYAASIGSIGTIIGTPPNALLVGYLADTYGIHIGFGQWMAVALPMAIVFLLVCWWLLTCVIFRTSTRDLPGGRAVIAAHLREMGPITRPEIAVLAVFLSAAAAWIVVPLAWPGGPITDEVIAIYLALALFLIPARRARGVALLNWDSAVQLPWGVLLLFGGGLSLAAQITDSGLASWIGAGVSGLGGLAVVALIALVAALVVFLTEVTSNTATAATFLPIMGGVAAGLALDPLLLTIPVALAATCAFMLPVATPPNAIAFGSGYVSAGSMVRAGLGLNVISIVLITLTNWWVVPMVFGIPGP